MVFTKEETEYLLKLRKRNASKPYMLKSEPLEDPISENENLLRNRIQEKCDECFPMLIWASYCGLLPNETMNQLRCRTVCEVIGYGLVHLSFEDQEARKPIPNKVR